MGYGLLNLGSLLLGLIAWILPVTSIAGRNKTGNRTRIVFSFISGCACAVSMYFQILYQNHLVRIEDWSALMDTSNAVALVPAVLLIGTIALNAVALLKKSHSL